MEGRIRAAAVIQLVVGLLNLFVVSWVAGLVWLSMGGVVSGIVMAICTLGLCPLPIGSACSLVAIPIGLLGILEIAAGAAGLSNPQTARPLALVVAALGVASAVLANPLSVVAGVVVFAMLITPGAQEAEAPS